MEYKEIFKTWWFWALVFLLSVFGICDNLQYYEHLLLMQYTGIIFSAFLIVLIMTFIIKTIILISQKTAKFFKNK